MSRVLVRAKVATAHAKGQKRAVFDVDDVARLLAVADQHLECVTSLGPDTEGILLYAMRYALGRRTFAPSDVIQAIRSALPLRDAGVRQAMIDDIERAALASELPSVEALGDPQVDAPGWLLLLDELRANAKSDRILL